MSKSQILYIHGGTTFKSKKDYLNFLKTRKLSIDRKVGWSGEYFSKALGDNFHVIRPRMPRQDGATYSEWALHFERHLPLLKGDIILIGESLGGTFLAKYLSENKISKKILSVYLVCAPFDGEMPGYDLAGGFNLKSDLSLLEKNTKNLYLIFFEKDEIVKLSHAEKYGAKLKKAKIIINRRIKGHYKVDNFPEIVKMIKSDVKK